MPTVDVDKENLFQALNRSFTKEEFEELCFDFGIELEEETSEYEKKAKEVGADRAKDSSKRRLYSIDIPANRYDLLCPEGITRALLTFRGEGAPPNYRVVKPAKGQAQKLIVKPETAAIRPFVVAAVLRNIKFTEENYNTFIELQDKLHNNICRKRTLVAIGTHDLDTVVGPFTYEALPPSEINFVPLNQTKSMDAKELMTFYESDRKLSKYLHIIRDAPRYPVIYDSKRRVLSLPPIINSDHSKIKLTTKNVFIECTATDLTKAKTVLNTVVSMFSQYVADPFSVEPVEVVDAEGKSVLYPDLTPRKFTTSAHYINTRVGTTLNADEIIKLLSKMSLTATKSKGPSDEIVVQVPPTRSDILHACDIAEDVAIAFGYNNITETTPKANTPAAPLPLNKMSDQIRRELAFAGYTEVLPLILCSHDENFAFLKKTDDGSAVKLANPKTVEYQVVRTSLIPGLLKTIASNKDHPLPLKIFEVSDVVFKDSTKERQTRNQRNLCVVFASLKTSGFELVHGVLDRVMAMLNIPSVDAGEAGGYYIQESKNATFFEGRRADVFYNKEKIGSFGILHPEVIQKFEFNYPSSALELNLEPFV
ncbi:hypothetical protein HK101_011010 [Irineochytrium annulatum]|nr:hypothetical protein HK101_011010 [Irineochytrium annulatum]